MKGKVDGDGNPIKFEFTVDEALADADGEESDADDGPVDDGRQDHTGLEDVGFPDAVGCDEDTTDRITLEESEELDMGEDLDQSANDEASAYGDAIPPEMDVPSSEDEVEDGDEMTMPFPDDLKERWVPSHVHVPSTGDSMVRQLKKGTKVGIYYHDTKEWAIGTLKALTDSNTNLWDIQYGRERQLWPFAFENDTYGEDQLWVVVTKNVEAKRQRAAEARPEEDGSASAGVGDSASDAPDASAMDIDVAQHTDPNTCAYVSMSTTPPGGAEIQGCEAIDGGACSGLSKCTNRGCSGVMIHPHRCCFHAHFPGVSEQIVGSTTGQIFARAVR